MFTPRGSDRLRGRRGDVVRRAVDRFWRASRWSVSASCSFPWSPGCSFGGPSDACRSAGVSPSVRVGPGTRLTVQLDVENRSTAPSSVPDARGPTPPTLGRSARLVVARRARSSGAAGLVLDPPAGAWRATGSGPLTMRHHGCLRTPSEALGRREPRTNCWSPRRSKTSPRRRTPRRVRTRERLGRGSSSARARSTSRCAPTREGDDLRRIHWPSVARCPASSRSGRTRRSKRANGLVFLR